MLSNAFRASRGRSTNFYVSCTRLKEAALGDGPSGAQLPVRYVAWKHPVVKPVLLFHRTYDTKITAFDFSGKYRTVQRKLRSLEFEEKVVNQDFPVIVNFHAEWCVPWHETVKLINSAVQDSDYVCSVTLIIDENPEIVRDLAIKAIPTVIGYFQGYQVKKYVGSVTEEEIKYLVQRMDEAFKDRALKYSN